MPAKNPNRRRTAACIAGIESKSGPDDPRLPALRRDLRAAELQDHIERLVDQAPPLTVAQRDLLAGLLRPTGRPGE